MPFDVTTTSLVPLGDPDHDPITLVSETLRDGRVVIYDPDYEHPTADEWLESDLAVRLRDAE